MNILLLTLAILLITVQGSVHNTTHKALRAPYPRTQIHFTNELGGGRKVLIHCRDLYGIVDQGEHILNDTEEYEFDFGLDPLNLTKYYCHFASKRGFSYERVYVYMRDYKRCYKRCIYQFREDGIYGFNEDGVADLLFHWRKPSLQDNTKTGLSWNPSRIGEALYVPTKRHYCYSGIPHTLVTIWNLIEGVKLTVHCKSKDDDLGFQELAYREYYEFRFKPNIWGSTLFFCNFSWEKNSKTCDIYQYDRDIDRCCDACIWVVDRQGVHGINKFTQKADVLVCEWHRSL